MYSKSNVSSLCIELRLHTVNPPPLGVDKHPLDSLKGCARRESEADLIDRARTSSGPPGTNYRAINNESTPAGRGTRVHDQ